MTSYCTLESIKSDIKYWKAKTPKTDEERLHIDQMLELLANQLTIVEKK